MALLAIIYSAEQIIDIMFAKRLKELRTEKGMSQIALATVLKVERTTVVNWESGKREPDFEMLIRIADYFEVTCDYLLGRTDY